jgi:hypothetical protein
LPMYSCNDENYVDFIAHLTTAIQRQVAHWQAANIVLMYLAVENANDGCKMAI